MLPEDLVSVGGHPPRPSRAGVARPAAPRRDVEPSAGTLRGVLIATAFGAVLWALTVAILFATMGG